MKKSVLFIGRICSGKSSLAKLISEASGIPKASFGGYLFKLAPTLDLAVDRESLQNLGQSLIDQAPYKFLIDVIKFSGGSNEMIFEGVRHQVIKEKIEELSEHTVSFYIEASSDVRLARCIEREGTNVSIEEFLIWDDHIVEKEIEKLKATCTHILDGNKTLSELKMQVIQHLDGLI